MDELHSDYICNASITTPSYPSPMAAPLSLPQAIGEYSDVDSSFTSIATSSSSFNTLASPSPYGNNSCCSARSSISYSSSTSWSTSSDPRWSSSSFTSSSSSTTGSRPQLKPHPHRSSDPQWTAIRAATALAPDGCLHLHHFKILRQLGSGNLAKVFHCRLHVADDLENSSRSEASATAVLADFALKVVDTDALVRMKNDEKLAHVRVEGEVLSTLDHPFLPTLYAKMESGRGHTCFLMDYCAGGDLHTLLRRQPGGRFPLQAVRFYAAEVLLALEYLHASGYVYRDLKPENILQRADGHLMLSDFDLCLKAHVEPTVIRLATASNLQKRTEGGVKDRKKSKKRRGMMLRCCFVGNCDDSERDAGGAEETEETSMMFVAEPRTARSKECVGTHEYLAPEVISPHEYGAEDGHGNGVDWWAFGVLIYEMIYGRTPFKGATKEATLKNIKDRPLRFPSSSSQTLAAATSSSSLAHNKDRMMKKLMSDAARDLMEKLLVKDPRRRLGSARGAADIKRHPFFQGIQWPLIRNYPAPKLSRSTAMASGRPTRSNLNQTANRSSGRLADSPSLLQNKKRLSRDWRRLVLRRLQKSMSSRK